jgi:hypothetical protein
LVVQEKPDYPVFKTGLSSFCGFKPPDRTYSFTVFLTSLSLTLKNNREGDPNIPIGDPLVLRGILKFLGEINSPRTGVSVPPTGFSPSLGIFT